MWKNIEAAPADAILGLTEAFKNDDNTQKVNLGVGVYKDEQGNTPILSCIKTAENMLLEDQITKGYLPIPGTAEYGLNVQGLLFGPDSDVISSKRASTIQSPGGTGGLRVGADLIKKFKPNSKIWMSSPTWANHKGIFTASGFEINDYPYYDAETKSVNFDEMMTTLNSISSGDVVLLHVCCHNPTGVDLNTEQWEAVIESSVANGWLPFLDFAYQGFGDSVEKDRACLEMFAKAEIDFVVASSFSKNLALYNERVGALTVVSPTSKDASVAMSHIKKIVRVNYSNPPAHGGLVAKIVLADESLRSLWIAELALMRDRIKEMRKAFVSGLENRGVDQDFSYIVKQRGMFSFSGLSNENVENLKKDKSIYIVKGGRINVAGLTSSNIDYVCDSIAAVLNA